MASPHEEKYLEFAAVYVLGALDGDELREFEEHLRSGCAVCHSEVSSLREATNILPLALPRSIVSPDLKERILFSARLAKVAKAHYETKEEKLPDQPPLRLKEIPVSAPQRSWLTMGVAFAAVVMIIGFGLYITTLLKTIDQQNEFITKQKTQIMEFADELERKNEILKVLQSRRVEMVTMNGMDITPVAYGKIIWDLDRKMAVLQVSNLPPAPEGKEYQLWMMKDNTPSSAGMFTVVSEGQADNYFRVKPLEMPDKESIDAFAVTLEPKGGMPQPTGEMYLLGTTVPH